MVGQAWLCPLFLGTGKPITPARIVFLSLDVISKATSDMPNKPADVQRFAMC